MFWLQIRDHSSVGVRCLGAKCPLSSLPFLSSCCSWRPSRRREGVNPRLKHPALPLQTPQHQRQETGHRWPPITCRRCACTGWSPSAIYTAEVRGGGGAGQMDWEEGGKQAHLMPHSPCRSTVPLPGGRGAAMGRASGYPASITVRPDRLQPCAQSRRLPAAACAAGAHLPGARCPGSLPEW